MQKVALNYNQRQTLLDNFADAVKGCGKCSINYSYSKLVNGTMLSFFTINNTPYGARVNKDTLEVEKIRIMNSVPKT